MRHGMAPCRTLLLALAVGCAPAKAPRSSVEQATPGSNPEADYNHAVQLQQEGRHLESLKWFRSAVKASPGSSRLHLYYATALHNTGIGMEPSHGASRFVVRTSPERIQLRAEALLEAGEAIDLAGTSEERAFSLVTRARMLDMIGCPLDALEDVEVALRLHPNEPALLAMRKRLDDKLHGRRAMTGL